jgi:hypothetical protein
MLKIIRILIATLMLLMIEKIHLIMDVTKAGVTRFVLVVLREPYQNTNTMYSFPLVKTEDVECSLRLFHLKKMLFNN